MPADMEGCSGYDIYFINYCPDLTVRVDYAANGVTTNIASALNFADVVTKDDATQLGTATITLRSDMWSAQYAEEFSPDDFGKSFYYGCYGTTAPRGFKFQSPEDIYTPTSGGTGSGGIDAATMNSGSEVLSTLAAALLLLLL